jgi:hypothetical protein
MFAQAMRRVDPNIKIVASGATPAEMSTTRAARAMTGKQVTEFGGRQTGPAVCWPSPSTFSTRPPNTSILRQTPRSIPKRRSS